MANCNVCGEPIGDGAEACPACGAKVGERPIGAEVDGAVAVEEWFAQNAQNAGIVVGYSKKFDTPEFQTLLKASNKSYTRVMLVMLFGVPLATGVIGGIFSAKNAVVFIAAAILVFLIMLPIVVYYLIKRNATKTWDGEVIDFKHRRSRHTDSYFVVCRTDQGKKTKVRDYRGSGMYDYFQKGDRVRFHPRLDVPLEKYDKTHDLYLLCPFCGGRQPLENDDCDACGKPLLK